MPKMKMKPATQEALDRLQESFDAITTKAKSVKTLCMKGIRVQDNPAAREMAKNMQKQLVELEGGIVKQIEAFIFTDACEFSDQEAKDTLKDAAAQMTKVLQGEKQLRALLAAKMDVKEAMEGIIRGTE